MNYWVDLAESRKNKRLGLNIFGHKIDEYNYRCAAALEEWHFRILKDRFDGSRKKNCQIRASE